MEDLIYVVGTAFIKNGKVLISMSQRSSKKGKYTLVGGGVEKGETFKEAARREIQEEIGNGFDIEETELEEILCFREPALSDPSLTIEMHMMLAKKEINVELIPNEEIIEYKSEVKVRILVYILLSCFDFFIDVKILYKMNYGNIKAPLLSKKSIAYG